MPYHGVNDREESGFLLGKPGAEPIFGAGVQLANVFRTRKLVFQSEDFSEPLNEPIRRFDGETANHHGK